MYIWVLRVQGVDAAHCMGVVGVDAALCMGVDARFCMSVSRFDLQSLPLDFSRSIALIAMCVVML